MKQNGMRLVRHTDPSDYGFDAHLPVPVRAMYTVMGRVDRLWQTVLPATDDLHLARSTMAAANVTARFDRLVIARGNSAMRQCGGSWTTIECALPVFMSDINAPIPTRRAANNNVRKDSQVIQLGLMCVLGALLYQPVLLGLVTGLALIDCLYLMDKTHLPDGRIARLNHQRNWAYSLLNGGLLVFVLLRTFILRI